MTSIEWLEKVFNDPYKNRPFISKEEFEQAKQMHKAERISVLEEIVSRLEEDGLYALQGIKHTLENLKK